MLVTCISADAYLRTDSRLNANSCNCSKRYSSHMERHYQTLTMPVISYGHSFTFWFVELEWVFQGGLLHFLLCSDHHPPLPELHLLPHPLNADAAGRNLVLASPRAAKQPLLPKLQQARKSSKWSSGNLHVPAKSIVSIRARGTSSSVNSSTSPVQAC